MDKINFQNLPNTTTPVNATNLNLLQTNIENTLNTYSTTETRIGTWINNKPVYRKVIDVIKKDCRYVNWCIKNVKGFAIPSYLKSKVREKMNYHAVGYDDPYGECLDEAIGGCWYGA